MKRTLQYTADRGMVLTMRDLREFISDAGSLGIWDFKIPTVQLSTMTGAKDCIKKLSLEDNRRQ